MAMAGNDRRISASMSFWPIPVDTDQDTSKEVAPSTREQAAIGIKSASSQQYDTGLEACPYSTLQVFEESHKQVHQPDFSLQVVPDSYKYLAATQQADYVWAEAVQPQPYAPSTDTDETDKRLQSQSRPWWKRKRIWVAAGGGVLAIVAIIVGCVVGLGLKSQSEKTASSAEPGSGTGNDKNNTSGNNNNILPSDLNFKSACRGTTCNQLFSAQKFVYENENSLHIFARGRDGAIWTRVYDGKSQAWMGNDWWTLGGNFQSQPESVVWGRNRKRISVLGVSSGNNNGSGGGKIVAKTYRNGTWESAWLDMNATTNSPVTACFIPWRTGVTDYVDPFARGSSGGSGGGGEQGLLMTTKLFTEEDANFKNMPGYPTRYVDKWDTQNLGGILGSSVAVACRTRESGIMQDLIMYQRGTRSVAHTQRREPNSQFITWKDLGGAFSGEPVIAATSQSDKDPRIDFFGTGQDRKIYHFGWSKSANYSPPLESISETNVRFQSVPAVMVTTPGGARLDILAVGTDDRLKHRAYINNQWADGDDENNGWEDLGVLANSAPYVVELPLSASSRYTLGVFVLGKDNHVLFATWEVSASASWKNISKFKSIGGAGVLTERWMDSEP